MVTSSSKGTIEETMEDAQICHQALRASPVMLFGIEMISGNNQLCWLRIRKKMRALERHFSRKAALSPICMRTTLSTSAPKLATSYADAHDILSSMNTTIAMAHPLMHNGPSCG